MKVRQAKGKESRLTFGSYPEVSLARAPAERGKAKLQQSVGVEPAQSKRIEKLQKRVAAANTFEAVARGALDMAVRLEQLCSQIFRYAIGKELVKYNLAPDLRDVLKPRARGHHAAIGTDLPYWTPCAWLRLAGRDAPGFDLPTSEWASVVSAVGQFGGGADSQANFRYPFGPRPSDSGKDFPAKWRRICFGFYDGKFVATEQRVVVKAFRRGGNFVFGYVMQPKRPCP